MLVDHAGSKDHFMKAQKPAASLSMAVRATALQCSAPEPPGCSCSDNYEQTILTTMGRLAVGSAGFEFPGDLTGTRGWRLTSWTSRSGQPSWSGVETWPGIAPTSVYIVLGVPAALLAIQGDTGSPVQTATLHLLDRHCWA